MVHPLCLGKISKNVFVDKIKKTGFYGYVYDFSADYDAIAGDDILHIHNHNNAKDQYKIMLEFINDVCGSVGFIRLNVYPLQMNKCFNE